jgi:hypothetical protein
MVQLRNDNIGNNETKYNIHFPELKNMVEIGAGAFGGNCIKNSRLKLISCV